MFIMDYADMQGVVPRCTPPRAMLVRVYPPAPKKRTTPQYFLSTHFSVATENKLRRLARLVREATLLVRYCPLIQINASRAINRVVSTIKSSPEWSIIVGNRVHLY